MFKIITSLCQYEITTARIYHVHVLNMVDQSVEQYIFQTSSTLTQYTFSNSYITTGLYLDYNRK